MNIKDINDITDDVMNASLAELEDALEYEGDGAYDIWFARNQKAGANKLNDSFVYGEPQASQYAGKKQGSK